MPGRPLLSCVMPLTVGPEERLRPFLENNPDIAGAVLRIFMRAVRTSLYHTSPGAPQDAQFYSKTQPMVNR